MEERFYIDGEVSPSIVGKPVKSLGKWCNSMLSDHGLVEELRELIVKDINTIDKTFLPGKLKWWCLHFELLSHIRGPSTVYELFQNHES